MIFNHYNYIVCLKTITHGFESTMCQTNIDVENHHFRYVFIGDSSINGPFSTSMLVYPSANLKLMVNTFGDSPHFPPATEVPQVQTLTP